MSKFTNALLSIIRENDVVAYSKIDKRYTSESENEMLKFVNEHFLKYDKLPESTSIESRFQSDLAVCDLTLKEPADFYCKDLTEFNNIKSVQELATNLLGSVRRNDFVSSMQTVSEFIESSNTEDEKLFTFNDVAEKIKANAKERAENTGFLGFKFNDLRLDAIYNGLDKSSFNIIAFKTGEGKTWALIWEIACLLKQGHKVLLASWEMDASRLYERIIPFFSNFTYYDIVRMKQANLDKYNALIDKLKEDTSLGLLTIIKSPETLIEVFNFVIQNRVEALFIDGMYLIPPSKQDYKLQEYERLIKIARKLKNFALERSVPVIVTTQVKSECNGIPTNSDLAFSKNVVNESDTCFAFNINREDPEMVICEPYAIKDREGTSKEFNQFTQFEWSPNTGMKKGFFSKEAPRQEASESVKAEINNKLKIGLGGGN